MSPATPRAAAAVKPVPPCVVAMLKAPRLGTVKTRLAAELGVERATRIYRALVERQLAAVPAQWRIEVHFSPPGAEAEMRDWLGARPILVAQVEGDLGARMDAAVTTALARARAATSAATGVLVVGGDCPGLDAAILSEAAAALEEHDVVLGPASDGGYYLIGLKRPEPGLFVGIAWSTEHVLAQTLRKAEQAGLRVVRLPMRDDVDTAADWSRCAQMFPGV